MTTPPDLKKKIVFWKAYSFTYELTQIPFGWEMLLVQLEQILTSDEHIKRGREKIESLWAKGVDFSREEVQEAQKQNRMFS